MYYNYFVSLILSVAVRDKNKAQHLTKSLGYLAKLLTALVHSCKQASKLRTKCDSHTIELTALLVAPLPCIDFFPKI